MPFDRNLLDAAALVGYLTALVEFVPDFVVVLPCAFCGLVLWRAVTWRPYLWLALSGSWLLWLAAEFAAKGTAVLDATYQRWCHASEVTKAYAHALLELIAAWTELFLPFLSDILKWTFFFAGLLEPWQYLVLLLVAASLYAILRTFRLVNRHRQTVRTALFHGSFLAFGPLIWHLSGLIPEDRLGVILAHAVTSVPVAMSVHVLSQAFSHMATARSPRRGPSRQPLPHSVPLRLWLSYWSCWPFLVLLEAGLEKLDPRLGAAAASALNMSCSPSSSACLQFALRRTMFTFVIWLEFWQGSGFLQRVLEWLLGCTSILRLPGIIASQVLRLTRLLTSFVGLGTVVARPGNAGRLMMWVRRLSSGIWTLAVPIVGGVALVCLLFYLFYSAFKFLSRLLTVAVWLFAALDTAETLANHVEDFYAKKLSFWVLATLWEALSKLPYIGFVMQLVAPVAFSLLLLASDIVFKRAVQPLVVYAEALVSTTAALACGCCGRRQREQLDVFPPSEDVLSTLELSDDIAGDEADVDVLATLNVSNDKADESEETQEAQAERDEGGDEKNAERDEGGGEKNADERSEENADERSEEPPQTEEPEPEKQEPEHSEEPRQAEEPPPLEEVSVAARVEAIEATTAASAGDDGSPEPRFRKKANGRRGNRRS